MYTIKQASLRSGVSVPLLRAWERRYQIVVPGRTPAGYRLYDDVAVARLRAMRRLVDAGWTASEAARAVLAGEVPTETADGPSNREAGQGETPSSAAAGDAELLVGRFLEAAERFDVRGLEAVLDEAYARGSFETATETIVLPALRALGEAWAVGRIDVAAEHAASQTVERRLTAAFAAAGRATDRARLLVGLPPGSTHELGALAFATAARRSGLPVVYLGADVPAASWVAAAERTGVEVVVMAVPTERDAAAATTVLRALEPLGERLVRAVGGAGAHLVPRGDALELPESVTEAAVAIRDRLETAARTTG